MFIANNNTKVQLIAKNTNIYKTFNRSGFSEEFTYEPMVILDNILSIHYNCIYITKEA